MFQWLHVDAGMDGFEHGLEIMVDSRRNPDWNPFIDPYPGRCEIDKRRLRARVLKTTYVYDYPLLFERAILAMWPNEPNERPQKLAVCQFHELIYDESTKQLIEMEEPGTLSKIGMVAWRVKMLVPEYPEGREVVVIANDISHQIGSFSMREHRLYYEASRLSRKEGIPRIYIAANSGARIGLSADVSFVLFRFPPSFRFGFLFLFFKLCRRVLPTNTRLFADKMQSLGYFGH
ncbi:unnamed protein product [Gongylonema pulchrum]|uniref:CoA carboxyltransferase N-terminal domain-containing protein n=1 Tax=Gongylonema pulchrum TaxID=637853 RepID=A0A183EUT8_9BILA|nr:unnamed protein product [Gongylonema pulchrum]